VRLNEGDISDSAISTRATERNSSNLIQACFGLWLDKLLAWASTFTSGPRWQAKTTLLCIVFTVFVTGGIGFDTLQAGYYEAYYEKIEHPLKDLTLSYPPGSHQAKLNFRLTVPVVLHALGLHSHWILPALTIVAVVMILFLSCVLAYQISGSRLVALFTALEVSSTYTGSFGIIWYYDTIALALVALALLQQTPWYLRGALVFAAAFTDERGFIASLFVLPFVATSSQNESRGIRFISRDTIAILAALGLYFVARLWLQYATGMMSTFKGVGPAIFAGHIRFWHAGFWFALEGGWLFVSFAVLSLLLRKQYLRLAVFLIPISGLLVGGLMDGDILRSTAYIFPAIFVALKILSEHESHQALTLYAIAAFFISVIGGNYNILIDEITWLMPLPLYLFSKGSIALAVWVKSVVGWHD